ncbi:dihydrolipoyl dehydrogenase [Candidatus Saganbacteria bacterium]|nr:dihydrolipoyl dehydrogenase [Candidatus Saganbacteria bacterium]
MNKKYDIVILGGGPGGYVSAIRATQLGAYVAIIEKDKLGGTCLNYGCIPTKALVYCANFFEKIKHADTFGITAENVSIDLKKVVDRKNKVVEKLVKGVEFLLEKNKIEIIRGEGKVIEPGFIKVGNREVHSQVSILATGSSPICLPGLSFDGSCFMSSDDILNLKEIPQKLDIVGGGVIGLHFAHMFNILGSEVAIYESLPDILNGVDEEVVALMKRILSRRKIKIAANTKFERSMTCGKTLVCVGRTPSTMGLESLNLKMDGKRVSVNEKMETSIKDVYAIGDLVSPKQFAHVASEQGVIAVENAMGKSRTFDYKSVPYTIYTNPEVASVGPTEKEAVSREPGAVSIGKFPFAALGIAQAMGEIEGFVKVIADKDDRILGVHIIGPDANTIIGAAAVCVKNGLKVDQLAETIQAHPSYPESLQEAALSTLKRSLHSIN